MNQASLSRFMSGRAATGWRIRRSVGLTAAMLLVTFFTHPVLAQDSLQTEPLLRLNTDRHTALIRRIATDAQNRFVVTASHDKTARVWSLPDGKLQTILRVPIEDGNFGKLYAVALTPDGGTIAVAGWTGLDLARGANIYLFDRVSGALRQRLSGLPNVTRHLAYSKNGRYLAATLGEKGIQVFDVARGYRALPSDGDYGDESYWAEFDATDRLVTASFDGFVRLYAAGRYDSPVAKKKPREVGRPFSVAFSPDRQRVAVGFYLKTTVVVLSAIDLRELHAPDVSGIDEDLSSVAWSRDGRQLYAGGLSKVVRRWDAGGLGRYADIGVSKNTIEQLLPLNDGGMLFGTSDPSFGIIDSQGRVRTLQGPGQLDFRAQGALRLSRDGKTVEMSAIFPSRTFRFNLSKRTVDVDPAADPSLAEPVTSTPGLSVSDWKHEYKPKVNDKQISLQDYEWSSSLSIAPTGDRFVLGTAWYLRVFDGTGKPLWPKEVAVPGAAWAVNIPLDRQLVVAALGDGTLRWYRLKDGAEVLALFIHPDGRRWITWTPQGYYDASAGADELIGWHVNNGWDRAPDFYSVALFRERFYRPDVIARVLDTLDTNEALRLADIASGRGPSPRAGVGSILPPAIRIVDKKEKYSTADENLTLTYAARARKNDPVTRVEVWVNGGRVNAEDQVLSTTDEGRVGIVSVKLPPQHATVLLKAYNTNGASEPAQLEITWVGGGAVAKPNLYVLAIGVREYEKPRKNELQFSDKDAEDFVKEAKAQEGGLYEHVVVQLLRNTEARREAILDGLDWVRREMTSNDVAMVFFAGHGVQGADKRYRFEPYDVDPDRLERTSVSDHEMLDFIEKFGGKTVVFLDTCYSGGMGRRGSPGDIDGFANDLKNAGPGIVVFTGSTGDQFSLEDPKWGHGAFTLALLEAMQGQGDLTKPGVVRVSDLQGYLSKRVKALTNGNQKPMVAVPKPIENLPIIALR
jgi:WD40 repeat protein